MYDYIRQLMTFVPAHPFSKVCIRACYIYVTKCIDTVHFYHFVVFISYHIEPSSTHNMLDLYVMQNMKYLFHVLFRVALSAEQQSGDERTRLLPTVLLLQREATMMEMALRGGDLQHDTQGTYRRLETQLQEYWVKYMNHEMFLPACGSLYGVRPTTPLRQAKKKEFNSKSV